MRRHMKELAMPTRIATVLAAMAAVAAIAVGPAAGASVVASGPFDVVVTVLRHGPIENGRIM